MTRRISFVPQAVSSRTLVWAVAVLSLAFGGRPARSEYILAARYFTAGIDIYDPANASVRNFITIMPATDPFPGLTGLAYSASLNRLFATANTSQRIYSFNAESGALVGYHQLGGGFAPAGIAVAGSGDLYVADNGGTTIMRFTPNATDASLVVAGTIELVAPASNLNGLALTASGDLLVSSAAGAGIFRYSQPGGQAAFNTNPLTSGQVAVSPAGTVAAGGVVFSSNVSLFSGLGIQTGNVAIDATLLPQPALPYVSADVTNPQGVAFDGSGNLIVAAMGRTNPLSADDNFQSNGGLFVFDPIGTMLIDSLVNTTPYTGVIVAPVPEPTTAGLLAAAALLSGVLRLRRRGSRTSSSRGTEPGYC